MKLDQLPEIVWTSDSTAKGERPTFGKFQNDTNTITVSIVNRHPIDIMRTLAHELTHYKQQLTKGLDPDSGETGSPEEDEANAVAGQIMRHFDEENPDAFNIKPVIAENADVNEEVWDHPNPVKKHKKLSPPDKAAAKHRAKAAGRKYPNMVDNIWAARR